MKKMLFAVILLLSLNTAFSQFKYAAGAGLIIGAGKLPSSAIGFERPSFAAYGISVFQDSFLPKREAVLFLLERQ